jgi:acetyl esterase/lipase
MKRRRPIWIIAPLVALAVILAVVAGTRPAPREIARGLPYGRDPARRYDLYPAAPGSARPLVIVIHGGGGFLGTRSDYTARTLARILSRAGWTCASIDHRSAAQHPWPAALDDVRQAIRHFATAYQGPVILAGFSAGGLLAEMAASDTPNVLAVVAVSAPQDLADTPGEWPRAWLAGRPLAVASPLRVVRRLPPTLLIHGTADPVVPVRQAERMTRLLRKRGCDVTYVPLSGVDHFDQSRNQFPSVVREHILPWLRSRFSTAQ